MTTHLYFDANGGSNGATPTTGDTGSGDAPDSVANVENMVYTTSSPLEGAASVSCPSNSAVQFLSWDSGAGITSDYTVWMRYKPSATSSSSQRILRMTGTNAAASWHVDSTGTGDPGKLRLRPANTGTLTWESSSVIETGTEYIIQVDVSHNDDSLELIIRNSTGAILERSGVYDSLAINTNSDRLDVGAILFNVTGLAYVFDEMYWESAYTGSDSQELWTNDFEGTDGVYLTAVNSDFNDCIPSGTSVAQFSNTGAHEGSTCGLYSSSSLITHKSNIWARATEVWWVGYIDLTTEPTNNTVLASFWNQSGTYGVELRYAYASNEITLRDNSYSLRVGATLALGEWNRVAARVAPGAGAGAGLEVYVYNGADLDGLTPTDSDATATGTTWGSTSSINRVSMGILSTPGATMTLKYDDVHVGTSEWVPTQAPATQVVYTRRIIIGE